MNITIQEVVKIVKGQLIMGDPKTRVRRACVDSRLVEASDLFFALKGDRVDGHEFAMTACRAGASGVIVSKLDWLRTQRSFQTAIIRVLDPYSSLKNLGEYLRHGFRGPVVGITGSNGKTTTKQMLANILKALGPGLATKGNYNSQIGLPLVLSELQPDHQWMALEMGASEPGNIAALADVARPSVGVITSIGPAHLKTFGSLQAIARSKWEIMDALPQDGTAIVPWGESLFESHIRAFQKKIIFFGEDPSCPVRATSIEMGDQVSFLIHVGGRSGRVTLPIGGRFNVMNALAAAAAAMALGCTLDQIIHGLQTFEPAKMRMETIRHPSGAIFINDAYNANPASMTQSVRSMVETHHERKRIVVMGTMLELGEESPAMHFNMGTELGRTALDQVYLIGQDTEKVLEGAQAVGAPSGRFILCQTKTELLERLKRHLNNETIILFKGSRGIRLEEVVDALMKDLIPAGGF